MYYSIAFLCFAAFVHSVFRLGRLSHKSQSVSLAEQPQKYLCFKRTDCLCASSFGCCDLLPRRSFLARNALFELCLFPSDWAVLSAEAWQSAVLEAVELCTRTPSASSEGDTNTSTCGSPLNYFVLCTWRVLFSCIKLNAVHYILLISGSLELLRILNFVHEFFGLSASDKGLLACMSEFQALTTDVLSRLVAGEYEETICSLVVPKLLPPLHDTLWVDDLVLYVIRACCQSSRRFCQSVLLHVIEVLNATASQGLTDVLTDATAQVQCALRNVDPSQKATPHDIIFCLFRRWILSLY